jgi:D-beta-D-heptose 7-phosphate kinase/D-beta-D-heptose 1-phosphate adenosyltransferase
MNRRDPATKLFTQADLIDRHGPTRTHVLAFTNGCFDVLHAGHIVCLFEASKLGDQLVVAVNSNASMRMLDKGPDRPIVDEADRVHVVAALESVDAVCLFEEETPLRLIEALQPDVLVKGADYRREDLPGADVVEARGGRVVLIPLAEGQSTRDLVGRIKGERP